MFRKHPNPKNQQFSTFFASHESVPKLNPKVLLLVLYVFLIIFNDSELNFCPKPVISSVISPVISCCLQTINFQLIFLPQQVIFRKI
jgi:hypothetical protein